jgi:hypothetical protein
VGIKKVVIRESGVGSQRLYYRLSLIFVLGLLFAVHCSLFAVLTACGRKGDPTVPVRYIPGPVEDLVATPKENTVILSWNRPDKNADGSPIKDLAEFVILRADISEDVKEYVYKKIMVIALDKPEPSIIKENMVYLQDAGEDLSPPGLNYGKTFGYKVFSINKSKILGKERETRVTLSIPPGNPDGFMATSGDARVMLNWTSPSKRIDGSELTDLRGYNIYRGREKGVYGDTPVNPGLILSQTYTDQGLENNKPYYYIIKAVNTLTPPWNEGPPSAEISVTPQKMTPPDPPKRLIAVPAEGKIFLTWDENKEPELAGYKVYRSLRPKTGFILLTPAAIIKTTFTDTDVSPKIKYYYRVTVVDNAPKPNESLHSEEVEAQIR